MKSYAFAVIRSGILAILSVGYAVTPSIAKAELATQTALTVTRAGETVTSISAPVALKLSASVISSGSRVNPGQVRFCDYSINATCTGMALLGTAQLTESGSASVVTRLGFGEHLLKANFVGTTAYASSSSTISRFQQHWHPGASFSVVTSSASKAPGTYTLSTMLAGLGASPSAFAPQGKVDFIDTSNGNAVLASGSLSTSGPAALHLRSIFQGTTNGGPLQIAVADFNGDGIPDMAVYNYSFSFTSGTVTDLSIFLGAGLGEFKLVSRIPLDPFNGTPALKAADINSDGKVDLILSTDGVSTFLGQGDGTFKSAAKVDLPSVRNGGYFSGDISVADVNGDGILDIVGETIAGGDGKGYGAAYLAGKGDGTFGNAAIPVLNTALPLIGILFADVNGDGIPDLVALGITSVSVDDNGVKVSLLTSLGEGNGKYHTPTSAPLGDKYIAVDTYDPQASISIDDLNNDSHLDVVVKLTNYDFPTSLVFTSLGNGDGTFAKFSELDMASLAANPDRVLSATVIDMNLDGVPDLVLTTGHEYDFHGKLYVLEGNGDGTFQRALQSWVTNSTPTGVIPANLAGDGRPGLIVLTTDNTIDPESGTFQNPQRLSVFLDEWSVPANITSSAFKVLDSKTHVIKAWFPGDGYYRQASSAPISITAQSR